MLIVKKTVNEVYVNTWQKIKILTFLWTYFILTESLIVTEIIVI